MASSSSSSPLAPALSSRSWNHDVFLSFREEDTRKTFVDHLYSALVLQGIDTYKDDETLLRGELIGTSLMKAIEESQIAVIVFSVNYADSSCAKTKRKIWRSVLNELENNDKVESWKKALVDASNISGWEPKNIANGHESKAIKDIVEKISLRLQLVTAKANEKLIGIASRVHRLKLALQIESGGVIMIGIWGVGGGGKTTLASSIYDEISRKFDGSCFIAILREESNRRSLKELEKEILSQTGANNDGRGRCLKDRKLCNRKVLIVFDDVDQLDQLEALVGSPDWFGEGSRIIITTRDEHLLNAHGVVVHDISLLHGDEASELFRKYAFRGSIPMKEYDQLSKAVVSYSGGIPLALKVLGSSLCDKTIDQWRSALARLKETPDNKKLKVSFDGLTKAQKDLFLDIACFFKGVHKDKAMVILDACGFHPTIGVEELRQKALITISEEGEFDMHDVVQEMGHYIVRGEHPKNPEKHSRVWKKEDIERISAMDATMELDKIEAIRVLPDELRPMVSYYSRSRVHENPPPPPIVAKMRNLRYIQWEGDLPNPSLNNFPPRELCCLILCDSMQDQLWNGCKVLPNLRIMKLCELDNLIVTPNFDEIRCLEKVKICGCPKLEEIHESLGRLDRLVYLYIQRCWGIKKFPSIIRLKKLEILSLEVSPEIFELSEIQQKMDNLLGEEDISSAVWELSNLNDIRLCFFRTNLKELDLYMCHLRDEDISSAVWDLPNLQKLNLEWNNFSRINFSLMRTPRLRLLYVSNCSKLVELSELPSSLAVFDARGCRSLETFGDISNCKWLWKVSLRRCRKLGPPVGYMLLDSMLKRNAIIDRFISVARDYEIPKEFIGSLYKGNEFRRHLPHDWYNDFSGFLINVVTYDTNPTIKITIGVPDEGFPYIYWPEPKYTVGSRIITMGSHRITSFVGYVSFDSLKPTACVNSAYDVITISLHGSRTASGSANKIGFELVPRKSKDDPVQTTKVATDSSEFWDDIEHHFKRNFTIEHGSKSIKIKWVPFN